MSAQPAIVLIHGAFAESASWADVIRKIEPSGAAIVAAPNPLRSVSEDAATLRALLTTLPGPTVVVGHSYGGQVMSTAATGLPSAQALVYVAAFAPAAGESIGYLSSMYPGSTLGDTLQEVPLEDGTVDFRINPARFQAQFAHDIDADSARIAALTQRPLRSTALEEGAGDPAWRTVPSWFVFGDGDKNIPVEAHRFMAERAASRRTVEIPGASHALALSQPGAVADLILEAVDEVARP